MKRKEFLGLLGGGMLAPLVAFLPKQEQGLTVASSSEYLGKETGGNSQVCRFIADEDGKTIWCEGSDLKTYSWQKKKRGKNGKDRQANQRRL